MHRIDLHIAYAREGISGLLEDERHPDLYFDRVPAESALRRDRRRPSTRRPGQSALVRGSHSAARTRSRKMTY